MVCLWLVELDLETSGSLEYEQRVIVLYNEWVVGSKQKERGEGALSCRRSDALYTGMKIAVTMGYPRNGLSHSSSQYRSAVAGAGVTGGQNIS